MPSDTADPAESGILFVLSDIVDTATLSPDVYSEWYDMIHIPEVLNTGGVASAARYMLSDGAGDDQYPYLALYVIPDMKYLNSEPFKSIRVHHEMLPGPRHSILDLARFDFGRYIRVQGLPSQPLAQAGTGADLVTLVFKSPREATAANGWTVANYIRPVIDAAKISHVQCFGKLSESATGSWSLGDDAESGMVEYLILCYVGKGVEEVIRRHAPKDSRVSSYRLLRSFSRD
ncbi:hypothetical protein JDV02_006270 [Purpureocillium takamizusanense]|uniref:Uncharacterized protein n=1 Tax=Purpureocillium takamizusanense TaxID=2060973 RepID=A0A9Q8QKB5_9HYPO|nr:uncharacterized protein JDV02_006270 [Purpureocillium takamizusanense]UNI20152.1 hypothetical protein JDV02_006270 [Purpureocillium takamizusanense]